MKILQFDFLTIFVHYIFEGITIEDMLNIYDFLSIFQKSRFHKVIFF